MNEPALRIKTFPNERYVIVAFEGRMDAEGVREVTAPFDLVTDVDLPIAIDLSAVTFLESLGIAMLVRLAKRQKERGLEVAVIPGPGPIARILGIARLDRVLIVAFTREQALQELGVLAP